jgi:hypothetical protein
VNNVRIGRKIMAFISVDLIVKTKVKEIMRNRKFKLALGGK